MNFASRRPLTLAAFLEWEERQERKYEFDGVAPIAVPDRSDAAAAIGLNIMTALIVHLRGKPFRSYGNELRLLVAGRVRYPDAFIVRSSSPERATLVDDPVVVVEVPNGTDAEAGRERSEAYRDTRSIMHHVVLDQRRRRDPGLCPRGRMLDEFDRGGGCRAGIAGDRGFPFRYPSFIRTSSSRLNDARGCRRPGKWVGNSKVSLGKAAVAQW